MGLDSIIGHDRQKEFLLSLLAKERLPHAFLFSGQEGIGKRTFALEFIKYMMCEKGTGCDNCRPCLKLRHGSHPDLTIVEPVNDSIGIGQSRAITREVSEPPYEGKVRAIIMDGADKMTREAANALLKTLEEPPPNNVFFLISSSEKEIPLTIRSRSARVAFSPLSQSDVEEYFVKTLRTEREKASVIARQSYGSIGWGLFWAEKDNLLLRRRLGELVVGRKRSFVASTAISERISKTDKGLGLYLSFLLSFFRDLYLAAQKEDSSRLVNKDLMDLMDSDADRGWIDQSVKKIQETMFNMRYNVNKWLLFENLLLHIMR